MNNIQCVTIRAARDVRIETIEGDLEGLQKFVGGYIETLVLGPTKGCADRVFAIFDEDGLLKQLPATCLLPNGQHIVGPVAIVLYDGNGNFKSMPDDVAARWESRMKEGMS